MKYFTIGHRLPDLLAKRLFGDRKRWGLKIQPDDPCWKEWERTYLDFYVANQRQSIGNSVNHAGYAIMGKVDLEGKRVLEIGPGQIAHIEHWKPSIDKSKVSYVLADIQGEMLDRSSEVLKDNEVPYETSLVERNGPLPFDTDSFDIVVSFYSLEHLHPLAPFLAEFRRILKPRGQFVGGIPAEGGLAWGMGRFLTSRRWLHRNTSIDPDKIICWEHPNFAEEILAQIDDGFEKEELEYWPLKVPSIDLNLILSFVYTNQ